ncbi:MAG: SHOCT domain-containing protein [Synechococcales bacterium]|nr:SHOCT domain-containing protein [Synechococcales bacterium]
MASFPKLAHNPLKTKTRPWAIALALSGAILPGLHKFYLKQWRWGLAYLLLFPTHIPQAASLIEAVWLLLLDQEEFDRNFNRPIPPASNQNCPQAKADALGMQAESAVPAPGVSLEEVRAIATVLRELEQLRQDGLISEYEFEQKRRQLLDKMQ